MLLFFINMQNIKSKMIKPIFTVFHYIITENLVWPNRLASHELIGHSKNGVALRCTNINILIVKQRIINAMFFNKLAMFDFKTKLLR